MAGPGFTDEEQCFLEPTERVVAPREAGRFPRALVVVVAAAFGLAAVVGLAGTSPLSPAALGGVLQAEEKGSEVSTTAAAEGGEEGTTAAADGGEENGEGGEVDPDAGGDGVGTPGWGLADADQSCQAYCANVGLECDPTAHHDRRAEVESEEAMGKVVSDLGEKCASYNTSYGSEGDVPVIGGDGECFVSSPDREAWTWSCTRKPWPLDLGKKRLCMCTASCTNNGDNCMASQCCSQYGQTCYKKNDHWASCNATCNANMKWVDNEWQQQTEKVWDCEVLGGESTAACAANGEDCSKSECCTEPGMTCFQKNDHWASCNRTCDSNYRWVDSERWEKQEEKVWDCDVLGTPGALPPTCTANGDNCAESKCCSTPGMTCFKKNDKWSSCNKTCESNYLWNNDQWELQKEKVWDCDVVGKACTAVGENCMDSKCCSEAGTQCFKKNDHWASCNRTCESNMLWKDDRWQAQKEKVWECDVITLEAEASGETAEGEASSGENGEAEASGETAEVASGETTTTEAEA